jgi:hypothetical protein
MSKERGLMGRREFLVLSSTVAAATAAVGPKLFAAETVAPKRLAVGYVPSDDGASVVAASSIPAGDGRFIGTGARVTVSGASGAATDPRHRRAVDLLVNYSYWDGATRKEAPFRAWACSGSGTTACQGSPVKFTVPVDEVQKISFSVGVERAGHALRPGRDEGPAELGDGTLPVTLSMLSDPASIKLVRGFYVIVPLFDGDAEPRWSAYTLQQREGRWALHDRDGNVAPFEHFVLRVDYA